MAAGATSGGDLVYRDVLAIVLAGGRGSRLEPLTRDRAKPAVPFGGLYRIIDFTLSNCINSDLRKILVLTQYKATSLNRHIDQGWKFLCRELGEYIEVIPPQQRIAEMWYQGTADAIYQNVYTIEKAKPRDTMILAGDHIYKMNYARMIDFHRDNRADLTVACLPVPRGMAREFGVMGMDGAGRITSFVEKPGDPPLMPDQPGLALASMGIYVFNTDVMYEQLFQDAAQKEASSHDFGKDIIPAMMAAGMRIFAYPFRDENRKTAAYWRNVGTLDAYFQTSMDLISIDPILNLYDQDWPIHTYQPAVSSPQVRAHRPGPPGRGVQLHRLSGGHRLGRPGLSQHHLARRAGQQLRPGRGFDPLRRRGRRPPGPRPPRHHRQGREDPRRVRDRLEPRPGPAPRPDHHPRGPHRRRQGRRTGAVCVRDVHGVTGKSSTLSLRLAAA